MRLNITSLTQQHDALRVIAITMPSETQHHILNSTTYMVTRKKLNKDNNSGAGRLHAWMSEQKGVKCPRSGKHDIISCKVDDSCCA